MKNLELFVESVESRKVIAFRAGNRKGKVIHTVIDTADEVTPEEEVEFVIESGTLTADEKDEILRAYYSQLKDGYLYGAGEDAVIEDTRKLED